MIQTSAMGASHYTLLLNPTNIRASLLFWLLASVNLLIIFWNQNALYQLQNILCAAAAHSSGFIYSLYLPHLLSSNATNKQLLLITYYGFLHIQGFQAYS